MDGVRFEPRLSESSAAPQKEEPHEFDFCVFPSPPLQVKGMFSRFTETTIEELQADQDNDEMLKVSLIMPPVVPLHCVNRNRLPVCMTTQKAEPESCRLIRSMIGKKC